ncbi:PEP/pyruvate-binding domain-containing protein [Leucobacter soli]|uniref:Phosphoenolpyruvate synthase n=1 Tax=Leucobacter soli TaxID=2812850 RepID=A0A916JWY7_9MICO|nr:PEP/pyruvate-binding domain-containing protein [Leucobacter soli]CAG7611886.1 Phosphoenolpyruvate synthase [Leucobacter soli]
MSAAARPLIQFFDEGLPSDHELLGGKCASLVTMTAAGMPVPPGFAVTTATYDEFVGYSGLAGTIAELLAGLDPDDVTSVDGVSQRIRDAICSVEVSERLRDSFDEAWDRLQSRFAEPVPVAVRSSATAEDLPDASFAGQQDTYLWLTGAGEVREHIRKCWASLYTSRAITYRLKNGIPEEGLSMAVAVQKMVSARTAGVAMTMNPSTGDRSKIVIDASWGIGEAVVSGHVTPDNIMLDKVMMSIVSEHIGDKHIELVPDPAAKGLIELEVDAARRGIRSLSDDELRAVAELAKRAEQHYGTPQDVEWAIDRDLPAGENLLLLQARPETVHSSRTPDPAPATAAPTTGVTSLTSMLTGSIRLP